MPNKYSHSVVLAHYSSLGLIDLPNDQYVAYLKTYSGLRGHSVAPRSRKHSSATQASITPSTGYSGRHRIPEEQAFASSSVTGRKEYGGIGRRDVIIESDEGSGDERIVLHEKYGPLEPAPQSLRKQEGHKMRAEKRKLPSISTFTGRSSSEPSEGVVSSTTQQQAPSELKCEPEKSLRRVVDLDEDETPEAASILRGETATLLSSEPKTDHVAVRAISVDGRTASSFTQETRIHHPDPQSEPNFDAFSDKDLSEITITGVKNGDSNSSADVLTCSTSNQPVHSTANSSTLLSKSVDATAGFNHNLLNQGQCLHNRSHESISSVDSEYMVYPVTALPPAAPHKVLKPLRSKGRDDVIDPSFFETFGGASFQSSASMKSQRFNRLHSKSTPSSARSSQQYSRESADLTPPDSDFWRGLDEVLSDSDASVIFPPDIAKCKTRDCDIAPVGTTDRNSKDRIGDGEVERPTTAPATERSTRDASAIDKPLPELQSRINVTGKGNLDKTSDSRHLTTVQLVDTSAHKKKKMGFLRKLGKKSHDERKP